MDVFGNFYLMSDICQRNCDLDNLGCASAGLWDILKLRIQPRQEIDEWIFASCAIRGNIPFMRWLIDNNVKGYNIPRPELMNLAAKYGHLDMVKLLHENGKGCTTDAMDDAAWSGHLDVIKWLHENRTEGPSSQRLACAGCTKYAMDWATQNGYLDVVVWLFNNK